SENHADAFLGQERKQLWVLGNGDYRRIDLEKSPLLILVQITGQRPGPQADQADSRQPGIAFQGLQDLADGALTMVVGQRFTLSLRKQRTLVIQLTMDGSAVNQKMIFPLFRNPVDAEKAAVLMQRAAMNSGIK